MKQTLLAIALGLVMTITGAAMGMQPAYVIPHGNVTVDGDLSEWTAFDEWHNLDLAYSGIATDLSDAKYAARWNNATNMLYVAVTGVDTDHVFLPAYVTGGWNTQDAVEVYVEASGLAPTNNYANLQDYAQQYTVSPDGTGSAWAVAGGGMAIPAATVFAAQVNGDVLSYEIAVTPYTYYAGLGGTAMPEAIRDLAPGQIVGIDVVMNSLTSGGDFAMLSNNLVGGKFKYPDAIQQHTLLVPEPATMSLLALGGLALLRKRR